MNSGVADRVVLSVHRWLRPDEKAAVEHDPDVVAKTIKEMARNLPVEREITLDTNAPLRWLPDVGPGRYLVVVRVNYDYLGTKEMAEVAFPVEFQ
jgi:hypothetical protein